MATIFVNSNAVGLNDGSSWADAYTTLSSATSAADGSIIAVAETHVESFSTNTFYTFGSNISIICSTVSGTDIITEVVSTIENLYTTGGSLGFDSVDGLSIYGLGLAAAQNLILEDVRTERCTLKCGRQGSLATVSITTGSQSSWESYYDRHISESTNSNDNVVEVSNRSTAKLIGGTIESSCTRSGHSAIGVLPDSSLRAHNVDCSLFLADNLLDGTTNSNTLTILTGIKLNNATVNLVEDNAVKQGSTVIMDAVDQDNNQIQYNYEYRGIRSTDSSIYIDESGAFQNQSHKFVTNAITKGLAEPLRLEIAHGIADFSTAKTLSIEIAQDSTTTQLTDAEVWIEVEYPLANNSYEVEDNRAANTPAAVNQPTSTAAWTGLSGTNARQKCEVTTTQTGVEGLYKVYFCIAKPSTTVYVNPEAQVS